MNFVVRRLTVMVAGLLALATSGAYAQAPVADPKAESAAAFKAAEAAMTKGPADIKLADQAVIKIPAGQTFIPTAEAGRLLKVMGNRAGDGLLGLVMPLGQAEWFVVARNIKSGYIKDDDAKDWKADDMLTSIKEGTEESNKERRTRGIREIDIIGWVQPPTYDAAARRLVWALSSKEKGAADSSDAGINYNTYALGRDGYISLNLVTSLKSIERDKPVAHSLLAALDFNEGKRYADFNSSTDKVAEYGLAALVAGVAAKKLGLLAAIGVFLLKFWKIGLLAVVGFGALFAKFFGRKKSTDAVPPPPAS
ncbi:MAG: DUF2167 domain-containing protein [Burkholderiales bacterium]